MNPSNYTNTVLFGNALDVLKQLPDGIAQCCVTSPPYWGLRDYGTGAWEGGDPECDHVKSKIRTGKNIAKSNASTRGGGKKIANIPEIKYREKCQKCGAVRTDFQIGLEPTPELYISRLVKVFGEVKRVLKKDGTLWLNIGDSYAGSGKGGHTGNKKSGGWQPEYPNNHIVPKALKPKDLCMIPARVAMALQADGWYLRSEIIWHKPNCMPESVKDRPTNAHEKLYLLSKSKTYYYDWEAIAEPLAESTFYDPRRMSGNFTNSRPERNYPGQPQNGSGLLKGYGEKRNKRTVWEIPLKPYKEAHFAVYPPQLVAPCIKAGSKKNDLIVDTFFGSGTTGEVALRLGRKFLGIELNEKYKPISDRRLKPLKEDLFIDVE